MSIDNPQQPMSHKEAKASAKAQKAYAKATRPWYMKKRFWALGIVAILIIGSAIANMGNSSTPAAAPSAGAAATATAAPAETSTAPEPAGPELTTQQKNAVRSAENYLSFKGFSRKGLISQLSSDAGDGFAVADATVAVDSLDVDWNAQAVRAAEGYLDFKGFSCSGLKEQLSSDSGDGFTAEQATYGAEHAGACD